MRRMRKSLLRCAVLLLPLVGCVPSHLDYVKLPKAGGFAIINIDGRRAYLIDPRAESCFLIISSGAVGNVPCDKLKKNLPEAAAFITWVPDSAEAPAVSAPTP
ncbi:MULTISPECIES: hypothetical protein [unclassified Myxococcus]|uniref:hypothetical protein n=2 Tax=Myxococcaceae TaxID=31 RepID=UPI0011446E3A|nr:MULTISPECIES: hypothetical protein [unclassified Myxococcus]NOK00397.1 hypothetical protein [Myxococcus xanthus]